MEPTTSDLFLLCRSRNSHPEIYLLSGKGLEHFRNQRSLWPECCEQGIVKCFSVRGSLSRLPAKYIASLCQGHYLFQATVIFAPDCPTSSTPASVHSLHRANIF